MSKNFIFLFLPAQGLCCCIWAFSSWREWGLLFIAVHRLLIMVASLVVEHNAHQMFCVERNIPHLFCTCSSGLSAEPWVWHLSAVDTQHKHLTIFAFVYLGELFHSQGWNLGELTLFQGFQLHADVSSPVDPRAHIPTQVSCHLKLNSTSGLVLVWDVVSLAGPWTVGWGWVWGETRDEF